MAKRNAAYKSQEIKLESGVPIPPPVQKGAKGGKRGKALPWHEMEIGQSFFLPEAEVNNIHSAASRIRAKTKHRYVIRNAEKDAINGVRVWRVA